LFASSARQTVTYAAHEFGSVDQLGCPLVYLVETPQNLANRGQTPIILRCVTTVVTITSSTGSTTASSRW
jgi:hypothetical protein